MNKARLAGIFYLLTMVTGILALAGAYGMFAANLLSTLAYIGVTVLFYELFKPVNRNVSLVAALLSAFGCAVSLFAIFGLRWGGLNVLAVFGVYCVLIGYLIFKSTFIPRWLGIFMALGGLSWMTFASPSLTQALRPFNFVPGILAEGTLTVWLLVRGGRLSPAPGYAAGRRLGSATRAASDR